MNKDKQIKKLRKLLGEAMHASMHIDEKRLDSQRSQHFICEIDEKTRKARKIIKVLYED